MHAKSEDGFTLIELVVVIAILGILGALALPRYTNIAQGSRDAAYQAVMGAFRSGITLAHSQWRAQGSAGMSITLEGVPIAVNGSGWPVVTPADPTQDSAAELWGKLMAKALPQGWTPQQTPLVGAGIARYNFGTNTPGEYGQFEYDASTGKTIDHGPQ